VDVIDAARKVRSGRIAIRGQGVKPMGLALSADGRTLFASTGRGGSVAVIDTASLRVERVIPAVGARPWGIAVSNDGTRLYTANGNSDDVSIVDLQAGRVTAKVRAGNLPWGIAVSPQR
jgi:YVTN family beta-propeller protein